MREREMERKESKDGQTHEMKASEKRTDMVVKERNEDGGSNGGSVNKSHALTLPLHLLSCLTFSFFFSPSLLIYLFLSIFSLSTFCSFLSSPSLLFCFSLSLLSFSPFLFLSLCQTLWWRDVCTSHSSFCMKVIGSVDSFTHTHTLNLTSDTLLLISSHVYPDGVFKTG